MQTYINIQQLSCERDDRLLINELALQIQAGDLLQIEGANGSGKTTLLRLLSGLCDDFEGEIRWFGEHRSLSSALRGQMLYFGHSPGVKLALSARENLAWMISLGSPPGAQLPTIEQLDQGLAQVGLAGFEDIAASNLSAGQCRRVALARLWLLDMPLWILDEPFTAIDREGVQNVEQLLLAHTKQGGAVVITSHHALDVPGIRKLRLGLGRGQWALS